MATTKEDLLKTLSLLDHTDPTQWTDDGLPRMDVIQTLAGDKTITRAQVNDVNPGFARADLSKTATEAKNTTIIDGAPEVQASGDDGFDPSMEPEVNGPGEQLTEDQVKAILARRIVDADRNLEAARTATSEAHANERKCEKRADRARFDFQRRFPPISVAENIQQHLARQQEMLLEKVTGQGAHGRDQLDQAMERRNSRGWSRPSRPVQNSAG